MVELDEFRKKLDDWLDQHADELAPNFTGAGTLDDYMAQIAKVRRLTFDAGWARHGWPERVGGLLIYRGRGGSSVRAGRDASTLLPEPDQDVGLSHPASCATTPQTSSLIRRK